MLKGKTVYIPPMGYDSARVLAAAFRAVGLCAEPLPPSDERTREVSGRYASGDECLPFQILTGDVMKLFEGGDVRSRAERFPFARLPWTMQVRELCARSAGDIGKIGLWAGGGFRSRPLQWS